MLQTKVVIEPLPRRMSTAVKTSIKQPVHYEKKHNQGGEWKAHSAPAVLISEEETEIIEYK